MLASAVAAAITWDTGVGSGTTVTSTTISPLGTEQPPPKDATDGGTAVSTILLILTGVAGLGFMTCTGILASNQSKDAAATKGLLQSVENVHSEVEALAGNVRGDLSQLEAKTIQTTEDLDGLKQTVVNVRNDVVTTRESMLDIKSEVVGVKGDVGDVRLKVSALGELANRLHEEHYRMTRIPDSAQASLIQGELDEMHREHADMMGRFLALPSGTPDNLGSAVAALGTKLEDVERQLHDIIAAVGPPPPGGATLQAFLVDLHSKLATMEKQQESIQRDIREIMARTRGQQPGGGGELRRAGVGPL